jgi:hypothetical protein
MVPWIGTSVSATATSAKASSTDFKLRVANLHFYFLTTPIPQHNKLLQRGSCSPGVRSFRRHQKIGGYPSSECVNSFQCSSPAPSHLPLRRSALRPAFLVTDFAAVESVYKRMDTCERRRYEIECNEILVHRRIVRHLLSYRLG